MMSALFKFTSKNDQGPRRKNLKREKKFKARFNQRLVRNWHGCLFGVAQIRLRGSVHFDRYGYELLMKNFLLGLYLLLNIPSK